MEHLEEDLTCPVCFSLFEEPRVLPCSHTFCRRCLESVLQATVEQFPLWRALRVPLKCPSCRHMFDMPSAGLSYLPLNYSLVAIVEKYRRQQKLQRERELAESTRPPACAEHSEQPLNVYCLTDRTLVCGFCLTLGEHRSHDIESLASACAREGRALEESTRALLSDDDDVAEGDDGGAGAGGRSSSGGDDDDDNVREVAVGQQEEEEGVGDSATVLNPAPEDVGDAHRGNDGDDAAEDDQHQEEVEEEARDVERQGEGRRRRRTTSGGTSEEEMGSGTEDQGGETGRGGRAAGDEAVARGAKEAVDEQKEERNRSPQRRAKQRYPGPWATARTQLLELEARRTGYEVLVNQEAAQVEAYFAALRDDLGKQQMAVMEYMEAASRRASLGYERAIGVLRGVLDEHAAVLALAGEAQDAMLLGEPVAFLQKMHVFRERYELLCAAACAARPEPPSFGPRCQDYLVRGWADVPLGRLRDAPLPRLPYDDEGEGDGGGEDDGGGGGVRRGGGLGGGDLGSTDEDGAVYGHNHHLSVILEEEMEEDDDVDGTEQKADELDIDRGWGVGAGGRALASRASTAADVFALLDGDADDGVTEEELATAWLPFEVEQGLVLLSALASLRWADAAALAARAARISETSARKVLGRGGRALLHALGPASSRPALLHAALWLSVALFLAFCCCCFFASLLGRSDNGAAAAGKLGAPGAVGLALLPLLPCVAVVGANALMRRRQGLGCGWGRKWAVGSVGVLRAVVARVRAAL
ncbi:uncharacterized protein LOC133343226 [Lethenteron reissneri]|uniref:uncharacterized protein LOC133343226 n=1 Tax=Lethenteron reissneri TaxID=7753 RepID=UPI002AB78ECF|nr:uncharacterized protein LOC133343226 [Lethenteron reissneri]